jgi:exosome complex RNA-binding protein Rrp42 (RNase PH superfamily)
MRLSVSERAYIERGIQLDVRNDGRGNLGMRRVRVTVNELPHAHGSARCVLGASATEVLVSVKAELVAVVPGAPEAPCVECAAQTLVGGGGAAEDSALAAALQALLGAPGAVPRAALAVAPAGRWQWRLLVDALVLAEDGSALDAASVAAAAALRATRLPALRAVRSGSASGAGAGAPEGLELELNDDPGAAWALPCAASLPLALTLHYVKGLAVVDATAEEVACATASACIGVSPSGSVCFVASSGREGIAPQELGAAIAAAQKLVPVLFGCLEEAASG